MAMEMLLEGLALVLGAGVGLGFSWLALNGVLAVTFKRPPQGREGSASAGLLQ